MKMMKISIELIDPNPHRRFYINPIDQNQVDQLIRSYKESGDFGVLPARKVGDRYQIAAGHHRLSAMAALDFSKVDLKVADLSDLEMYLLMVNENATQHGGKPASQADSVAGAIVILAEWFTLADTVEQFNEMAQPIVDVRNGAEKSAPFYVTGNKGIAFQTAKSEMLKGSMSGRAVQQVLGATLKKDTVWTCINSLQAMDGVMAQLITEGREVSEAKREVAEAAARASTEAEEARIQAEDERIRKAAEEAERASEMEAKRAEKARIAAEHAKQERTKYERAKVHREAEAAALAAKIKSEAAQEAREQSRKDSEKYAEKQRKEIERQKDMADLRAKQDAQLQAALAAQMDHPLLDPRVPSLLPKPAHQREFLDMVTKNPTVLGCKVFDQVEFLEDLAVKARSLAPRSAQKDINRDDKDYISVRLLVEDLGKVDAKLASAKTDAIKKNADNARESGRERRVDGAMRELEGALSRLDLALTDVQGLLNADITRELVLAHPFGPNLRPTVQHMYNVVLPGIEKVTGLEARRMSNGKYSAFEGESETIIEG